MLKQKKDHTRKARLNAQARTPPRRWRPEFPKTESRRAQPIAPKTEAQGGNAWVIWAENAGHKPWLEPPHAQSKYNDNETTLTNLYRRFKSRTD